MAPPKQESKPKRTSAKQKPTAAKQKLNAAKQKPTAPQQREIELQPQQKQRSLPKRVIISRSDHPEKTWNIVVNTFRELITRSRQLLRFTSDANLHVFTSNGCEVPTFVDLPIETRLYITDKPELTLAPSTAHSTDTVPTRAESEAVILYRLTASRKSEAVRIP